MFCLSCSDASELFCSLDGMEDKEGWNWEGELV